MDTIRAFTEEEARERFCPFTLNGPDTHRCVSSKCLAWVELEGRITREDHSGGQLMMLEQKSKRPGAVLKREGMPGSQGIWILEARGHCRRLIAQSNKEN